VLFRAHTVLFLDDSTEPQSIHPSAPSQWSSKLGRAMACELRLVVIRNSVLQIRVPALGDHTCLVAAPAPSGQSQEMRSVGRAVLEVVESA
jgi:hypothetical protein